MMRRRLLPILALVVLAGATPAPAAADHIPCDRGPEDPGDYIEFLSRWRQELEARIFEKSILRADTQERRDELVHANGGAEPDWLDERVSPAVVLDLWDAEDRLNQLDRRIGLLEEELEDLDHEILSCQRDLLEPPPNGPHWERVGAHAMPDADERTSRQESPGEVREATCLPSENGIAVLWEVTDPRDPEPRSKLEFAYRFDQPPQFVGQGADAVPLRFEATITGHHDEDIPDPSTTGGYGVTLRTTDQQPVRPDPKIVLTPEHIPDPPVKASFDLKIPHGASVGTYYLWTYVILPSSTLGACGVAWEYRYVE